MMGSEAEMHIPVVGNDALQCWPLGLILITQIDVTNTSRLFSLFTRK
jgi:hypothetical protein